MKITSSILIKQKDGYTTKLTYMCCEKKTKASILILHGMAEHKKRYYSFAQYLINLGFDVYIYDHRGHGTDKKINELGHISNSKGYQLIIDDAITVSKYIAKNNKSNKFILFGHSMGSLIARNVIQTYDKYNGVILSGTAYPPKFALYSGLFLTSLVKKIKGPKYKSKLVNNLILGGKKYVKLADRTAFDWLTRSYPIVGEYVHDPYCGFICTASFYHDLLKLTSGAASKKLISLTPKNLSIYIISGEIDPVGGYGRDVNRLISLYKSLKFTNITYKLYPECRHELINELNYEEVYEDIHSWLLKKAIK